jgi:hypothetical protein
MSLDLIEYPFIETKNPMRDDPFCSPVLQPTDTPSPELFDQEWDNDEEVNGFHCSSEQMDTLFHSRDASPSRTNLKISIPPASAFTNSSSDSSYGITSSQYSFDIPSSESDFFNLSEFDSRCSASREPQLDSFLPKAESVDPMPFIPPFNPVEAHGTMDLKPYLFADNYSTAMQQFESITCVDPAALSGSSHLISDPEAQMAPVEKPFTCPHCPFGKSESMCIRNWFTLLASVFA